MASRFTAASCNILRGRLINFPLIGSVTMKTVRNIDTGSVIIWTASSEFGTYRLCEQRRFRRACASAQSRQNLRCSLIQAVNKEEPSDRKPDPWPLWMAGHAQLKFIMTECSKTQIRLTGLIWLLGSSNTCPAWKSSCQSNFSPYTHLPITRMQNRDQ